MKSEKIKLRNLATTLDRPVDLFICSASFEERCKSAADKLPKSKVRRALIAETEHKARYVSENGDYLRTLFGPSHISVLLDTTDPISMADALWAGLRKGIKPADKDILVDVTTFTHEALLILVRLLILHSPSLARIRFVYVAASDYSIGDDDKNKWLSKGVSEVRSVLGYSGVMRPAQRQHLIVLVGYEHERAAELIETYEPNLISLGHGKPGTATQPKHEIANKLFHELAHATASTYGEVRTFMFSANNPLDVRDAIEKQIKTARGFNSIVAPMNTKLSTLGAVLASLNDDSIQICYARANQYNYKAYSTPSDECYVVELPELFAAG